MVQARKYVVTKEFQGIPKRSDYEIVEYELPPLQDGEILVKTEWVSVDPYLRAYRPQGVKRNQSKNTLPYDQHGFQVAIIQESKDPQFPVGTRVVTHLGWSDYNVIKTENQPKDPMKTVYKLIDLKGLSPSLGIGAVGMPGATAYFAFLNVCQPKAGETVVVTAAAGAVGALVGQIAKIKGCRTIGFTGSDEKVQRLVRVSELGYDAAFNYKTADIANVLKQAAPNGIDSYFDGVGGELSSIVMNQMNDHGRVVVIGAISAYNSDPSVLPKASILQPTILFHRLKVEGFTILEHYDFWSQAFEALVDWIKSGQLKAPEHITQGFDKIYDAFVGMLAGENFGKAVVKL